MSRPPYRSVEEALFHLQNDLEERPPHDEFASAMNAAEKEIKAIIQFGETNERARCAALVRVKGCICGRSGEEPDSWINGLDAVEYEDCEVDEPMRVKVHNPICPQAIAAEIEAGR